jgi:hypothetical protein
VGLLRNAFFSFALKVKVTSFFIMPYSTDIHSPEQTGLKWVTGSHMVSCVRAFIDTEVASLPLHGEWQPSVPELTR